MDNISAAARNTNISFAIIILFMTLVTGLVVVTE